MNIGIIVAAGTSKRFGKTASEDSENTSKDKLLQSVLGVPVIYYSIQALHDHPEISYVIIVANQSNKKRIREIVKKYHFPNVKSVILGGRNREESVKKGLRAIKNAKESDIILIHNGANPLVTPEEISKSIAAAKKYGAAAVGSKMVDTIKEIKSGHIIKTFDREKLAGMQTPQVAKYQIIIKAFQKAKQDKKNNPETSPNEQENTSFTDDAALIENLGHKVKLIPASKHNFKITTRHDLSRVRHIMGDTPKDYLVGLGQDSHQFETTKSNKSNKNSSSKSVLCLGGIQIKDHPKLEADSDGDVILHALCNAISQALGEGSLGRFATSLCKHKNVTHSSAYLTPLLKKLIRRKYKLNNIGIMLECSKPKIDPLSTQIKKSISGLTGLPMIRIGITATTGEKLTPFGKGKGVQCFAIVSLKKC